MMLTTLPITINLAKSRRERAHGKEYLVAPLTLIVPGVLEGSNGPILYPAEEVARNAAAWNGQPLTLRHPSINGQPVSARTPGVAHLGTVQNAAFHAGKLAGEGWFDIAAPRQASPQLLRRLEQNERIELSTGLYLTREPAPPNSSHAGRPYTHVARNISPDHLAILPDEVGACSLRDGCGVNNSAAAQPAPGPCACDRCALSERTLAELLREQARRPPSTVTVPQCVPIPVTHTKGEGGVMDRMTSALGGASLEVQLDEHGLLVNKNDPHGAFAAVLGTLGGGAAPRVQPYTVNNSTEHGYALTVNGQRHLVRNVTREGSRVKIAFNDPVINAALRRNRNRLTVNAANAGEVNPLVYAETGELA